MVDIGALMNVVMKMMKLIWSLLGLSLNTYIGRLNGS